MTDAAVCQRPGCHHRRDQHLGIALRCGWADGMDECDCRQFHAMPEVGAAARRFARGINDAVADANRPALRERTTAFMQEVTEAHAAASDRGAGELADILVAHGWRDNYDDGEFTGYICAAEAAWEQWRDHEAPDWMVQLANQSRTAFLAGWAARTGTLAQTDDAVTDLMRSLSINPLIPDGLQVLMRETLDRVAREQDNRPDCDCHDLGHPCRPMRLQ